MIALAIIILSVDIFILFFHKDTSIETNDIDNNLTTNTSSNKLEDFNMNDVLQKYTNSMVQDIPGSEEEPDIEIPKGYLYDTKTLTDEQMVKKYLYIYKENIYYHIEDAYNQLDNTYKSTFGSLDNYKAYVNENKYFIDSLLTADYSEITVSKDDPNYINIYTFYDSEDRVYTIKEKAIMKFKIDIE